MSCTCYEVAALQKTRGNRTAELVRTRDDKRNNENCISIEVEQIVVYLKEICYINEDECSPPSVWRSLSSRSTRSGALRIRELISRDDEETKRKFRCSYFELKLSKASFERRTQLLEKDRAWLKEKWGTGCSQHLFLCLLAPSFFFILFFFLIWDTFDSFRTRKKNELASIFSRSFLPLPQLANGGPFPFQSVRFSRLTVATILVALDIALNSTSMSSSCGTPHPS